MNARLAVCLAIVGLLSIPACTPEVERQILGKWQSINGEPFSDHYYQNEYEFLPNGRALRRADIVSFADAPGFFSGEAEYYSYEFIESDRIRIWSDHVDYVYDLRFFEEPGGSREISLGAQKFKRVDG